MISYGTGFLLIVEFKRKLQVPLGKALYSLGRKIRKNDAFDRNSGAQRHVIPHMTLPLIFLVPASLELKTSILDYEIRSSC
jgi:hypothetical protein